MRRALELSQAVAMALDDEAQLAAALEESRADQQAGDLEIDLVDEADECEKKGDVPSPQPEEASEEDSDEEEEEEEEEAEPPIPVNGKYHLHAVVNHSGASASSGHYVSDVLDEAKGRWRRYDDSLVTVLSQTPREWRRNGYLLVYCHSSCFR